LFNFWVFYCNQSLSGDAFFLFYYSLKQWGIDILMTPFFEISYSDLVQNKKRPTFVDENYQK